MAALRPLAALAMLALALPASVSGQDSEPTQSTGIHGEATHGAAAAPAPAAASAAGDVIAAATCAVGHNATIGDAMFATAPYSAEERQQAQRLLAEMRRCSHHPQMVSTASTIRGAFAEAAVKVTFATPQAARTPPLGAAPLVRPSGGDAAFLTQIGPMYQVADCAVPRQPELVRAVLATDPGSPAEASAVAALFPTFGSCVQAGSQLRIDHRLMRYILDEALYRWSVVQRDGPASPWAAAAP
jgi:hypothetical protein